MTRRLLSSVVLAGLLACAAVVAPTATSAAAPLRAAGCTSSPYPPSPNATLQVSTTNPVVGARIKVGGIRFCANEDVDITISGKHVATAHTDAAGSFDPYVTVPGPAGTKPVCGIGASGLASDRDCLTINAQATGTTVQPGSNGGTAMTGVRIALLCVVALALLVAGGALATAGRRRSTVSS
jgi:hypothetical protein